MKEQLPRLDGNTEIRKKILPLCRLKAGEIWQDPESGHRVGVLDASCSEDVELLMNGGRASLLINDPPYNVKISKVESDNLFVKNIDEYMDFSSKWVANGFNILADNAHFYIWLGADIKDHFRPLPEFIIMMRSFEELLPRNYITLRNQRGYGTTKNWMWVRQELLHYIKGDPAFKVVYTDIPKILKGYYKTISGKKTENMERGKSDNIRPGNVWVDIQQVFYRMHENVPGCYAQKPLKAIERIIETSSRKGDTVVDFFAHSGATLIAGEKLGRKVLTCDIDPVFAELTIRRLERFHATGEPGWQWNNPFPELEDV